MLKSSKLYIQCQAIITVYSKNCRIETNVIRRICQLQRLKELSKSCYTWDLGRSSIKNCIAYYKRSEKNLKNSFNCNSMDYLYNCRVLNVRCPVSYCFIAKKVQTGRTPTRKLIKICASQAIRLESAKVCVIIVIVIYIYSPTLFIYKRGEANVLLSNLQQSYLLLSRVLLQKKQSILSTFLNHERRMYDTAFQKPNITLNHCQNHFQQH